MSVEVGGINRYGFTDHKSQIEFPSQSVSGNWFSVTTGGHGFSTPTGRYRIQSKEKMHWSNQYGVWMPYAMRVVGGIFIHELPLTKDGRRIGTNALGEPVSHGCIRVGVGDAESLYNWTPVGTPVSIS